MGCPTNPSSPHFHRATKVPNDLYTEYQMEWFKGRRHRQPPPKNPNVKLVARNEAMEITVMLAMGRVIQMEIILATKVSARENGRR